MPNAQDGGKKSPLLNLMKPMCCLRGMTSSCPVRRDQPIDDERHGGEGDALYHLDAGADDGAPAHQHVRPVPVEDARDDQRLVRAARHHADVETHLDGFSVRMSQLASCRQGLGVFSTTATSLFRSSDLNDCCCQGGNMDEQILPTRRYSSHFYDLFQPIVVKI